MTTRARHLLAVAVSLAMVLVAGACGSPERPVIDENAARAEGTATTVAPTGPQCDPDMNCVAESVFPGAHPVYAAVGDTEPAQNIERKQDELPVVFLVKEDLGDWLEVYLPIRPNGSTGFVKKTDVALSQHDYHIEVRLADFNLKAYKGDELILDAPIAIAADNTPTPGGLFYTTELLQPPNPDDVYGTYAYGLSGYSETLETFNGGPGQLGIHGTNHPELIGQKVSHGCIRMTNENIEILASQLPLGVPVEIFQEVPTEGAVVDG